MEGETDRVPSTLGAVRSVDDDDAIIREGLGERVAWREDEGSAAGEDFATTSSAG